MYLDQYLIKYIDVCIMLISRGTKAADMICTFFSDHEQKFKNVISLILILNTHNICKKKKDLVLKLIS